jgi:hypothetical protein
MNGEYINTLSNVLLSQIRFGNICVWDLTNTNVGANSTDIIMFIPNSVKFKLELT